MTVEEAQAALDEAQKAFDAAKGTGVSKVTAASRALSAAKRALATAQKAEAAGVNVGGLSRTEQLSTIRQAEYTAAQEEAGRGEKPTPPPPDAEYTYEYFWTPEVGGRGGYWNLVRFPRYGTATQTNTRTNVSTGGKVESGRKVNPDGSITITYTDGSTSVIPAPSTSGNITTGNITTGNITTGNVVTGPTLAKDVFKQTLAMFFGQADASKPWMDELYNVVSKFYLSGADVSEALNMALLDSRNNPNLKEFTDRFKGIYGLMDMKQAGKPVTIPTIAEYVSSQAKMADILTQANLAGLATTEYTGELIGKGNSVSTIADKIANVFNRIDLAPKDVKDTLSRYFPTADRLKLAGALLQGEKGVTQLADELAQYEVLAAAEAQGVGALGARAKVGGVTAERAQQYARAGGTYQSLLPKFGQVAAATPTVSKLAGISRAEDIGQVGVEKALILSAEAERAALEKLSTQEEARFAAKAGRMEQGLASQRRANRAF